MSKVNMSKEVEKLLKIQNALDKYKFHLCVHTDLEKECKWFLFMYFPNIENYLSSYNRPILSSIHTTIDELEDYLKKYDGFKGRW